MGHIYWKHNFVAKHQTCSPNSHSSSPPLNPVTLGLAFPSSRSSTMAWLPHRMAMCNGLNAEGDSRCVLADWGMGDLKMCHL